MTSITFSEERDEETNYGYCNEYQPHAVKRMFDYKNGMLYDMRWDKAGNLGQVSMGKPGEMFERERFLFWTEDNRIHAAVDDKHYSYYAYDHSGERRLKLTGINKQQDVCQRLRTPQNKLNEVSNADLMTTYTVLNEPTLYPSAYMVLSNKGYTKHYYAGADRVAARIGGGNLDHDTTCVGQDDDVVNRADELFSYCNNLVSYSEISHQNLDELIIRNIDNQEMWAMGTFKMDDMPVSLKTEMYPDVWDFPKMIEYFSQPNPHGNPQEDDEPEVYFYHSDHLGSASWITDHDGNPVQHLQYLPYGEPYVDQRTIGYSERFRFTGKERDKETGYGYFGARYMDHELLTSFISVDRYASKYPSVSPYAYCAWNPVKLIDPTGDTIVFKDKIIQDMFNNTYESVSNRIKELAAGDEEYESLSKIKKSMEAVRDSKTIFYYSSRENPEGKIKSGGCTYGMAGIDGVFVEITEKCINTLIHETKHASGYLDGDWEFDYENVDMFNHYSLKNYDLIDEFDAYRMEYDYLYYMGGHKYYNDLRIRSDFIEGEKMKPYIIPEYIQYNKSNPYKK